IVDATVPYDLAAFGLFPRKLKGLLGVVTMPFLHGGFGHLLGNSVSLGILLALLSGSQTRAKQLAIVTALAGGVLLWVVGRSANHIGSSLVIFGLVGLMICLGYFDRRPVPVLVALAVGVLFGTTILYGLLPGAEGVSWDGHACGLVAGIAVAIGYGKFQARR
ncbi:MAG: rhomboid family intramembrane serine protease, partial [Planctomycetota bacterium]